MVAENWTTFPSPPLVILSKITVQWLLLSQPLLLSVSHVVLSKQSKCWWQESPWKVLRKSIVYQIAGFQSNTTSASITRNYHIRRQNNKSDPRLKSYWPIKPYELLNLLLPNFFANKYFPAVQRKAPEPFLKWETIEFVCQTRNTNGKGWSSVFSSYLSEEFCLMAPQRMATWETMCPVGWQKRFILAEKQAVGYDRLRFEISIFEH